MPTPVEWGKTPTERPSLGDRPVANPSGVGQNSNPEPFDPLSSMLPTPVEWDKTPTKGTTGVIVAVANPSGVGHNSNTTSTIPTTARCQPQWSGAKLQPYLARDRAGLLPTPVEWSKTPTLTSANATSAVANPSGAGAKLQQLQRIANQQQHRVPPTPVEWSKTPTTDVRHPGRC